MQFSIRLGGVLLLLVLGACRSQQTAFSFQPPASARQPAMVVLTEPAPVTPPPSTQRLQLTAQRFRTHSTVPSIGNGARQAPLSARGVIHSLNRQLRVRQEATSVARPQSPARHDALHIVLGALLVLGGVVTGLALGGWLGLGVGAVVVLLGYYFIVLGIGGKHAWLEIFQEFFNM